MGTTTGRSLSVFAHATRSWALARTQVRPRRGVFPRALQPNTSPRRQLKTKSVDPLKELPQGLLAIPPDQSNQDPIEPQLYPTVIQQHLNNVKKFKDCVVLTRVGNFYELYADQAEQYGPLLNLKVAYKKTKVSGAVAMSGFQYFQLDRYLKMLVSDLNKQVAISDEVARTSASDQAKGNQPLYQRKVTRIVTAGTLVDESFIDPYESNFVLGVHLDTNRLEERIDKDVSAAVCWADPSSGQLYIQTTNVASLGSVVARIAPREVVLGPSFQEFGQERLRSLLGDGRYGTAFHQPSDLYAEPKHWNTFFDSPLTEKDVALAPAEAAAGALLLSYIKEKMQALPITFRPPVRYTHDEYMQIDKQSLRGLEVRTTLRDNFYQGSLIHSIRRTVTKSGTRLLTQRLVSPLMSIPEIDRRLDLVSTLLDLEALREAIAVILRQSSDVQRLLQKFAISRGDADDLLALAKTISLVERLKAEARNELSSIRDSPHSEALSGLIESMPVDKLLELKSRIENAIDEEGLSRQHMIEETEAATIAGFATEVENAEDGVSFKKAARGTKHITTVDVDEPGDIWIMKKHASQTLAALHAELKRLAAGKKELGHELRRRLGSNSLTLRWTAQLGHYCHVKGKDCRVDLAGVRTINSTKSTRSFYLPEWTTVGVRMDEAKLRIRTEEQRVFEGLRNDVIAKLVKLRQTAMVLDELDVAYSTATLAKERNLIRPIFHTGSQHTIIGGRHPMVDLGLREDGRQFTSNDCSMHAKQRILFITGPNMAGKSTYLRQTALISILGQMGSFVPADYASLSIVDKVYSRIGSADSLYKHQSTFMVEMIEVANILHGATARSLVIMDEIGRGTTPEDGTAVAYACLRHLHDVNGCKVLFATHFHQLADMSAGLEALACRCTDVVEARDGSWVYVHKMREGVNRESHALKVARIAGLPAEAIGLAEAVRESMQRRHEGVREPGRSTAQAAG